MKLAFAIVSFILTLVALSLAAILGTNAAASYITLITVILSSFIVLGAKKSFYLYIFIVIAIAFINYLHLEGILSYRPASTSTTWEGTLIYLLLMGVISYVAKISYDQIEDSYTKALNYAKELETLNKQLDEKVKLRTKQLEKSLEVQINSVHSAATVGRITQSLLHDLNASVSALQGAFVLMEEEDDPKILELAKNATRQIARVLTSTRELMQDKKREESFNPFAAIFNVVSIIESQIMRHEIKINYHFTHDVMIKGSLSLFERIVTNIIMNAIEELSSKDRVRVITITGRKTEKNLVISIMDNGSGISPKDLKKIFTSYSSKKEEKHMGIGLPFVRSIVENHFHGSVRIESAEDQYTDVIITFNV